MTWSIPAPLKAALSGLVQWAGEALVGLLPWIAYVTIHRYSNLSLTATCPKQTPNPYNGMLFNCTPLQEGASQEICILAVVISGLAVLSVANFGPRRRHNTAFTYVLVILAIGALIFGSLLYALFTAHLDREADAVTYYVLAVALMSSLFLAVEGAILSD